MSLIIRAAQFAAKSHGAQLRKYTSRAYIEHPARVAARVTLSPWAHEEHVAAAWLHDVLEDCSVTAMDIQNAYAEHSRPSSLVEDIVDLVTALTNPSKKYPWLSRADRKRIDREHLAEQVLEVKMIKAYDRIDNLQDMTGAPTEFRQMYLEESRLLAQALAPIPQAMMLEFEQVLAAVAAELKPGA